MQKPSDILLPYRVGALLYVPATYSNVAAKIVGSVFSGLHSVAFCLEDSIADNAVGAAESQLMATLREIGERSASSALLFVRVRNPQHLVHVHEMLGEYEELLTGYIFPKFDNHNADEYLDSLEEINHTRRHKLYGMPILESASLARAGSRQEALSALHETVGYYKEAVLNIRVGGNDLCSQYGVRRGVDQTIYDIGVVRDTLVDIVNIFGRDYVVSGPVWEYYGDAPGEWEDGLRREMRLDALNGFIGKTAIHPAQIPIIGDMLKVAPSDYEDALSISNWSSCNLGVEGGRGISRMNELKCHSKWAERILCLAEVYGLREDDK